MINGDMWDSLFVVLHLAVSKLEAMSSRHYNNSFLGLNHTLTSQFFQRGEGDTCVRAIEHACPVRSRNDIHNFFFAGFFNDAIRTGLRCE